MLELIGLLGGAATRLFPLILSFFDKGRDLKYELLRMDKEAELERLRGEMRGQEIRAMSDFQVDKSWADGLVEALKSEGDKSVLKDTGSFWINLLNGLNQSVRPILTYWWCVVLYTGNKAVLVTVAVQERVALSAMSPIIYTEFDRAVVGSIIGFWFVDRALRKYVVR